MGRFKNLTDYKHDIIYELITNQELVKALVNNPVNFLNQSLPNNFDPISLAYKQIFPYQRIPDIQEDPKTFITMKFNFRPHKTGTIFKVGSISFFVITHQTLISTDEGLRTDYLIDKIDEIFNLSKIVGITKMLFDGMGDFIVDQGGQWMGTSISYKSTDY